MEHVTAYVTWDQLLQLGIFSVGLANLIYMILINHRNKKK